MLAPRKKIPLTVASIALRRMDEATGDTGVSKGIIEAAVRSGDIRVRCRQLVRETHLREVSERPPLKSRKYLKRKIKSRRGKRIIIGKRFWRRATKEATIEAHWNLSVFAYIVGVPIPFVTKGGHLRVYPQDRYVAYGVLFSTEDVKAIKEKYQRAVMRRARTAASRPRSDPTWKKDLASFTEKAMAGQLGNRRRGARVYLAKLMYVIVEGKIEFDSVDKFAADTWKLNAEARARLSLPEIDASLPTYPPSRV